MKVSSTISLRSDNESVENVKLCVCALVKAALQKARETNQMSIFENALFVYMGLIKVLSFLSMCATNLAFLLSRAKIKRSNPIGRWVDFSSYWKKCCPINICPTPQWNR